MNVLVDTSVWVDHFKQKNNQLISLLETNLVVCHPYVVIEVACGTPPERHIIIEMLNELMSVPVATMPEILALLDQHKLCGRGCGFVDMALLASTLMSETTKLWTSDKRLHVIATELNVAYAPASH